MSSSIVSVDDMIASDKRNFILLLRRLADFLERAEEEDIRGLIHGDLNIALQKSPDKRTGSRTFKGADVSPSHAQEAVIDRLGSIATREEGENLFKEAHFTKREFEFIARKLHLAIRKEDTVERLRGRILDATVGARLNSQAIRGN